MEGLFRFISENERRMGEGTDKASTHDEGHANHNEVQYKQENETTVIVGRRRCVMFEFCRFFSNREKNENTDSNGTKTLTANARQMSFGIERYVFGGENTTLINGLCTRTNRT